MSTDSHLRLLLDRWRQSRQRGQPLSPEELCRDCPELRAEFERRLAAAETADSGDSPSTIGLPAEREDERPVEMPTIAGEPSPPLPEGRDGMPVVTGYEIECELGRGAMGVVYKARQMHLNRVVALKMILAGGRAGPEERLRFFGEAKVIASIEHPGIVSLHDFGTYDGAPYFALEYCPGGTLTARLDGTPLPAAEAAGLVEQIAHAVQAAHEKGIIHRDLKPGNVLMDAAGRPRVTDFGLARQIEGGSGLTQTGTPMGTPSYMAPEQAEGRKGIGPPADVYALGAILYECLTGRPPFKGASVMETLEQVRSQEPVTPRSLQPKVPRDLETICLKCLEKDPARRYTRAADLAEDLRRWQAHEPIHARPVGPVGRALKWVRRRPLLAGMAAATVLALVGGTVVSTYFALDARQQKKEAQKNEGETRKALAEVEETLALGLLRALGHSPGVGNLNDIELDALEELASLPRERDRVRLLFFEQALHTETRAVQLDRRLEEALTAAVGLRRDLRDKVLTRAGGRLREGNASLAVPIVCARLVAGLRADDPQLLRDSAAILIEELGRENKSEPSSTVVKSLQSISSRIGKTEAAGVGRLIVERAATTTDPAILRHLSEALVLLAGRLAPDEASRQTAALSKRISILSAESADPDERLGLSEALVVLAGTIASPEAAALSKQLTDLAAGTTDPEALLALSRAFAALSNKLAPAEASRLAAVLGKQVADLAGTSSASGLLILTQVLTALKPRLAPAEARRLAAALDKQLASLAGRIPDAKNLGAHVEDLRTLSQAFALLASLLSPEQTSNRATLLARQVAELSAAATSPQVLLALAQVLSELKRTVPPADASRAATVLDKQFAVLASKTKSAEHVRALSQTIAILASHLSPEQSSSQATLLSRQVSSLAPSAKEAGALGALADAFAAVAGKLLPAEAGKQAAALDQQVGNLVERTTDANALRTLAQAVTVLASWLPSSEARKSATAVGARLARTLHRQRDNRDVPVVFEKLCALLTPQQQLDLLKQPGFVEPGPEIVVKSLGRHFHREFRDVWDLVAYVEAQPSPLDCASPLDRGANALRMARRSE